MQFLRGAGDRGGGDSEIAGQIAGALLELRAPFTVGSAGDCESQLESLGFLACRLFDRWLSRLLGGCLSV